MLEGGKRINNESHHCPKVSIITVTYNASLHLKLFLDKVSKYLDKEVELILIDGNSTDNTIDIINDNNHIIDYWRSEPDEGIYYAMNTAIKYANGKWIYFLGVDDQILEGFNKMFDVLCKDNTVYFGNTLYTGIEIKNKISKYDLTKFIVCHQGIFYPKEVFKYYKYDVRYKVSADHYLNILCFTDKRFRWEYHDFLIANYAPGGFSATTSDDVFNKDYDGIIRKYLGFYSYLRYRFRLFKHSFKIKNHL